MLPLTAWAITNLLKITSIVSSLIFLLFVGTGSYARTFAKQDKQQKTESKDKQEKNDASSNENDIDGKPIETVVQLDVFQAISLVNAQLRWKDFHAEETRRTQSAFFSKKQTSEVAPSKETEELFDSQSVLTTLTIPDNFVFVVWSESSATNTATLKNLQEQESIIAFILNCGTYPHHQS